MNYVHKILLTLGLSFLLMTTTTMANTKSHDMTGHSTKDADRIGELFHESMVDGYMLSYYLMDLRVNKTEEAAAHGSHGKKEMEKPHHIMVYIMDKDHKIVEQGKVGFLIKGGDKGSQKIMGMYMSQGFGITADMKEKGVYTITTKAMVEDAKLMDTFDYEIK